MTEQKYAVASRRSGIFYGVGVGPGDPDLLTIKAFNLIKTAPVVSYLVSKSHGSQAKTIARLALAERQGYFAAIPEHRQDDIAIDILMAKDRTMANTAYQRAADRIKNVLNSGQDVVFLCEGDPLFFGSFGYLLELIQDEYPCQVIPGISSVNAAASVVLQPLVMLKESCVVVSGQHQDQQIEQALRQHDSVVIMKAGQARPRILKLLEITGRSADATYLEYIGRDNQNVVTDVTQLASEPGPYFSLFVVLPVEARNQ
ncbi:MAG: precorrin-2 C(20)-methyltransferase [Gammaproteobacteria bacterium]|nr:MAG: precorrin-2 C(20)-methyltransferase [Gammaproteobacteria bacterium]